VAGNVFEYMRACQHTLTHLALTHLCLHPNKALLYCQIASQKIRQNGEETRFEDRNPKTIGPMEPWSGGEEPIASGDVRLGPQTSHDAIDSQTT